MENKRFLQAQDVAEYMGISVPTAYRIIRQLNGELAAQGTSPSRARGAGGTSRRRSTAG